MSLKALQAAVARKDVYLVGADDDFLTQLLAVAEAARALKEHDDNVVQPLRPVLEQLYETLIPLVGHDHDAT